MDTKTKALEIVRTQVDKRVVYYFYKVVPFLWFFKRREPLGSKFLKAILGVVYPEDCYKEVTDDVKNPRTHQLISHLYLDYKDHLYSTSEYMALALMDRVIEEQKTWAEKNGYEFSFKIKGKVYEFEAIKKTEVTVK